MTDELSPTHESLMGGELKARLEAIRDDFGSIPTHLRAPKEVNALCKLDDVILECFYLR